MRRMNLFFRLSNMSFILRIAILLILIVVQPYLWDAVRRSALQLHSGQTNAEQLILVSQKLAESQEALFQKQPHLNQLFDAFPPSNTISQVVSRIEALADSAHLPVELKSIEDGTQSETGRGNIITKNITVRVTGSMEAVFSFLDSLEHQQEFARIESWDVATIAQYVPSSSAMFQMTLKVTYYFYDANT